MIVGQYTHDCTSWCGSCHVHHDRFSPLKWTKTRGNWPPSMTVTFESRLDDVDGRVGWLSSRSFDRRERDTRKALAAETSEVASSTLSSCVIKTVCHSHSSQIWRICGTDNTFALTIAAVNLLAYQDIQPVMQQDNVSAAASFLAPILPVGSAASISGAGSRTRSKPHGGVSGADTDQVASTSIRVV